MAAIVEFALKFRVLVVVMFVLSLGAGVIAFMKLNIESYPDPVPPLVDIVTQSTGQSAEEIERYITIPIEQAVSSVPNLKTMRTISLFGLSDVKLQFTYDVTYEEAEQKVLNRLSQLPPLPNGAQPTISPTSPIGEIFRYRVVGPANYGVMDLKTLQEWVIARRFRAVPGVIDVTGWGGKSKTFDVNVDLNKLNAAGLTLPQVITVLNNSNVNVGGNTVDIGPQSAVVRGIGLIRTIEEVRDTMLSSVNGNPIRVSDIAEVSVGAKPRLGIAGKDNDDDIVQGIVLMRRGQQSLPTIRRVEAEVANINASGILPPGVRIERIYDRSDLIQATTHTVLHNLAFGILLVFFVQWMFLGDLRSAMIVAATIPFALFFAIGILVIRGESANLLSIGAIDFGLIVDATVIMVENIFRHLAGHAGATDHGGLRHGFKGKLAVIFDAATQVNSAIFFSALIIIVGFLPLFTLSGVEGHIFGPMAKTYAYALSGGLLATLTVSPALSAVLLPERVKEVETVAVRWLRRIYSPLLGLALERRRATLAVAGILVLGSLLMARSLGLEFLPRLEEGNMWVRASMPPSISLDEGNRYVNQIRTLIKDYPEVETVVSQQGRPDDGTDATGFFNAEFFVPLRPRSEWRKDVDKEMLTSELSKRLSNEFPGIEFNFSQYIQDNVQESVSGVKGENSIKLFGSDLDALTKTAAKIKAVMQSVPGVTDLAVFNSVGQPTIRIDVDRNAAGRYGLAPGDINSAVQTAIGGQAAGEVYEDGSDRHFPIMVRLASPYRKSVGAIERLTIGVNSGSSVVQIPLKEVASVKLVAGASFIYREQQQRYLPIKFSVRGRDLGSTVLEAQKKIAEEVTLPPGYRLEWVGEFGNLQDAIARLKVIVPITILLISVILYFHFSSFRDMFLALSVIPMAMIGGIFTLTVTGTPFSVSAAIGFIALFGISVMEGIILLSYYNEQIDAGMARMSALAEACHARFRPVMMTCIAACVGLLPAAFSTEIGSQVQRPLALVVVGGIVLAPVLVLLVLPVLIGMFSRREHATASDLGAVPAE
ncbi:efflux RND transporter permease subunit [Rhodopseudomonas boonkerdii]|uniref:efflux RND transporter permease subunit n=1 Tax=Rhodopseudomonas boonkerdii TaxID=475937 RepID=UPI001E499371|nr:CusA/CzcA family heavy metal efflux RND transporter [Rhodopseudomonas boonkerdii]UGV26749.1 efflux RND transporter permease subunit [Rhodopseudomonas boonkerdii]